MVLAVLATGARVSIDLCFLSHSAALSTEGETVPSPSKLFLERFEEASLDSL